MKSDETKNIFIDENSIVEDGVFIYPSVQILGKCYIEKGSIIYPNSIIVDSKIGENCQIKSSYIENSEIKNNVSVGPFAHLRPNCLIEENCKIGNFVEIKNSQIMKKTKVSHLAYVGDAVVGENCNVGCGVIFANFDGTKKHKTIVGNNCFIGSNANLIAPLIVADNTYICAGTTVCKNTNSYDFVIGRQKEIIKSNYAQKYLRKD